MGQDTKVQGAAGTLWALPSHEAGWGSIPASLASPRQPVFQLIQVVKLIADMRLAPGF